MTPSCVRWFAYDTSADGSRIRSLETTTKRGEQQKSTGEACWGNGLFQKKPTIFIAIIEHDFGATRNVRAKAHFKSWDEENYNFESGYGDEGDTDCDHIKAVVIAMEP